MRARVFLPALVTLAIVAAGTGVLLSSPGRPTAAAAAAAPTPAVWNREPLQQQRFALLPLGSVQPRGWLRQQLRIQADGLSGHLDEFWPDVGSNSGWLGG